jgi:hypothetical protein
MRISKKAIMTLVLMAAALRVSAGGMNWNGDPMAAVQEALKAGEVQVPAVPPAKAVDGPAALEGVAVNGPVLVPLHNPDVRNVRLQRLISDDTHSRPRLVALADVCHEEPGDGTECSGSQFEFPDVQLVDRVASSKGLAVAHINGEGAAILDAYELHAEAKDGKLAVRLIPALQAYKGVICSADKLCSKMVDVCLELSPRIVDRYAGDVDMSQGVFIYREGRLREGTQTCGTSWEINGDFVRSCSGLFMLGLKNGNTIGDGGIDGNVFNVYQIDHLYDPATGELAQTPVGSYTLSRVPSCW